MKNETFTPERIKAEADAFFEWDGEDRSLVTTTSCLLFAQHIAGLMQARAAQPAPVVQDGYVLVPVEPTPELFGRYLGRELMNMDRKPFESWADEYRRIVASAPAQPAAQGEFGDAYQGAREDLAIWKRRALEAEARVRHQDQIIDHLTLEAQGESRMGDPVIPAAQEAKP